MRIASADGDAPAHLTYCMNIHPGESWAEVRKNLLEYVPRVKGEICPDAPFAVGLRLSGQAAIELADRGAPSELATLLRAHGLYTMTINGFPHGAFHGTSVKARVYEPDWRSPERKAYSDRLARILAALLPADVGYGSVSTVPGAFKPTVTSEGDRQRIADNLIAHAAELVRLREQTGKTVVLAIEPEPHCLLETIDETARFFDRYLRSGQAVGALATATGLSTHAAADALARHLGVCLDACHAAVEYESCPALVSTLTAADIRIAKIQLSSALRIREMNDDTARALTPFVDPVYLHQVVERSRGELTRYVDLPEALCRSPFRTQPCEWRVHFHVPVFLERLPSFETTQPFLCELLGKQVEAPLTEHLEVETYTWDVLPAELRVADVTTALARELAFCRGQLVSPSESVQAHRAGETGAA